ncbi:MAG: N-acetyl-gamma-glutamyl-phosphate reductase [Candidatus Omnitrophica bacterium]|nr:N-acetyl-gamma-glutamyl-phosphate reductase [Candidatus Omnitrophota bacterium]MCF7893916.1 N-acetyl-gamma-glutamyl-phosphate reductase [Candidatus Omnitrophota bacterium]
MIKVGILGATGFTGEKLVEILLSHPEVKLTYIASRVKKSTLYSDIFPKFFKKTSLKCQPLKIKKAIDSCDLLFLSLPHTVSMKFVPKILAKGKKVIDLSADYRFKKSSTYKIFYKKEHQDKKNLKKSVYGLTELFKEKIKKAQLIANPGCYPTSIIIALYPLLAEKLVKGKIVIDSKSSITGSGRRATIDYHYSNVANNFWAYKPFIHQHQPEVAEVLGEKLTKSLSFSFLPQVASFESGIYSTIHLSFKKKVNKEKLNRIYNKYYQDSPFIRISDKLPKLKDAAGTNFSDIGFAVDKKGYEAIVVSSLDNLVKGAAGQAVQNMNLMFGLEETTGLLLL